MQTSDHFVPIPSLLAEVIGEADPGTRMFRASGTEVEMNHWFMAICEHVGPTVSPGGVSMFARVSRPGVYKRLKAGRLTAFCFNPVEKVSTLFGRKKMVKTSALIYIPVSECQAWRDVLEARIKRIEAAAGQVTPEDMEAIIEEAGELSNEAEDSIRFGPKEKVCKPKGLKA